MRILVTGASGFIGSHLCERLIADGHQVTGVDRQPCWVPGVTAFRWDLRERAIASLLRDVDAVIHLAARAGMAGSWVDFDDYTSCNVLATQRVLEAAARVQVPWVIYCSSSSVYGRFAVGDEDNSSLLPCSPYGVSKLAGEQLCRAYWESRSLPFTIVRPFSIYGPRQRADMFHHVAIEALLSGRSLTIYGNGHQVRSNTYVGDLVDAFASLLARPDAAKGNVFNVGGGEAVSLLETLWLLESLTGRKATIEWRPARVGDQSATAADTTKARQLLGWQPATSLKDGLTKQVAWHRQVVAA